MKARFFIFCLLVTSGTSSIIAVFSALTFGLDTLTKVIDLTESITGFFKEDEPVQTIDVDDLIVRISERIETSNEKLYQRLSLDTYLAQIRDAVREVASSLTDLRFLMRSVPADRAAYTETFIGNSKDAIAHTRNLLSLVTDSITGSPNRVLRQINEQNNCNMSAINAFQSFYGNLMMNGMMVELLSKSLTHNFSLYNEKQYWNRTVTWLSSNFTFQEDLCKADFVSLIQKDIDQHTEATDLQRNNAGKYNWLFNDVFVMDPDNEGIY